MSPVLGVGHTSNPGYYCGLRRDDTLENLAGLKYFSVKSVTLGSEPVTRSRMLSNGISALSALQCSQDSISCLATCRVAASTRTMRVLFWRRIKEIKQLWRHRLFPPTISFRSVLD